MATDMGRSRFAPVNGNGVPSTNGDGAHAPTANGDGAVEAPSPVASENPSGMSDALRDKLGRFRPDNPGGPGNPFGRHVARNRRILLAAVSPDEVYELARMLHAMAAKGDLGAAKLLLQYLAGKPAPAASPDRVDHEEWEMRMEQPTGQEQDRQAGQLPHSVMLKMNRLLDEAKCQQIAKTLRADAEADIARERKQRERAERRARRKAERQRRK